jgi:hypothetical protein
MKKMNKEVQKIYEVSFDVENFCSPNKTDNYITHHKETVWSVYGDVLDFECHLSYLYRHGNRKVVNSSIEFIEVEKELEVA